ncbi:MAG TPA: TonB family protein [Acidobacteriota bacterium]|nr:TonB family protein [Acidobacteriota bacterium]
MAKYEKLGSYLLFEKVDEDKLSKNYLAGQFSGNQVQTICVVKKFDHSLSTLADFIMDMNQEAGILKQLANPNIIRANTFVQEKSEFGAVFEFVEGKSLRSVLSKCSQDGFPFTVDHSLLVASRLCTALEYLHSKKVNDHRLMHGYVCPEVIQVTYDGEIRVQYLGLARTLMKFPACRDKFFHDYKNYLAPEVLNQNKLDKASDIFGAGLVLYEMLHGEPLYSKGRTINPADAVESAQIFTTSGDRAALPDDLKKLLHQALAVDPSQRFLSVSDMRKALDLLLFSSEFSPTTFNLAFFMHSLFRDTIDEENNNLAVYKKTDVAQHVKEEPPPPPRPEHPVGAAPAKDIPPIPVSGDRSAVPSLGQPEIFGAAEEPEKSKMPFIIGILVVLAAIAGVGYFAFRPSSAPPTQQQAAPQPGLTPEQIKAQEAEHAKLQEEATRAQEEAKKKDEELKSLQAKLDQLLKAQQEATRKQQQAAAAGSQTPAPAAAAVDPAAIKKLQEEAKRLEEEKRKQEDLAEQKRKEAEQAAAAQAAAQQQQQQPPLQQQPQPQPAAPDQAATPQPQPAGETPAAAPAAEEVHEGQEVDLTPDVVRPEILNRVNPTYPPIAQQKKIEGTVILSVLVSESGETIDARVLRGAGGQSGLNEAAMDAVRKWKFRPAVKGGKRVRVWMTYPIVFKLR